MQSLYTYIYAHLTWKISHNSTYLPKRATSLMWSMHKANLRQHGMNFTAWPLSKKYHIKPFQPGFVQNILYFSHYAWFHKPSTYTAILCPIFPVYCTGSTWRTWQLYEACISLTDQNHTLQRIWQPPPKTSKKIWKQEKYKIQGMNPPNCASP